MIIKLTNFIRNIRRHPKFKSVNRANRNTTLDYEEFTNLLIYRYWDIKKR